MRGAIWLSDAALDGFSEARLNYIESVQQRAARDGKAHHADKSVRFFFSSGWSSARPTFFSRLFMSGMHVCGMRHIMLH